MERRELIVPVPEHPETRTLDVVAAPATGPYTGASYRMENDDSVHLYDYWRSIRKRLWLVIGIAVLITSLTAIYMSRKPDIFESHASVQVDLERINPALGSKESTIVLNNQSNDPAYFNTQLQILAGASLIRHVVKTLDLEHNKDFMVPAAGKSPSVWQSVLRTVGLGQKEKPKSADEVPVATTGTPTSAEDMAEAKRLAPIVELVQKNLSVEPVRESRMSNKDTRLIIVSYKHSDPVMATKIINALVDSFVEQNELKRTENNTGTSEYLKKRIAELQSDVQKDEHEKAETLRNAGTVVVDPTAQQGDIILDKLTLLNRTLTEARNTRTAAEEAYRAALLPGAANNPGMDSTARRALDDDEAAISKLEQKLAELRVDNTDEWPENQQVIKQLEALRHHSSEIIKQAGAIRLNSLYTAYNQAKGVENKLQVDFNTAKREAIAQGQVGIAIRMIQSRIDTNNSLLKDLETNRKSADVANVGSGNNVAVVEPAIIPDEPIGPRRLISVIMALIMSTALGCGVALFLEYLDDTVRSTDDVEKLLRLPALAVIPSVDQSPRRRLLAAGGKGPKTNDADLMKSELLIKADSRSSLAESYRQLRTSILLSTAGHAPKSLLVTSSVPSEGKTTTAVNTAISLAQTGASVLVLDADMRRPRLHRIFGIGNQAGLSTILSSEMSEKDIIAITQKDEESNLHLMPSGPIPPNPAELIGSDQMRRLLKVLERNFTHVVIDSPPIASFTDGVLLGSMVSGVLLVVHAGKSSRGVVKRSRMLLQDVGAKIFGVVLNNVNLRSQEDYYYYQNYYHQSYYKDGSDADEDPPTA
jgi:capsular exopolysaccharide synthesis family protein